MEEREGSTQSSSRGMNTPITLTPPFSGIGLERTSGLPGVFGYSIWSSSAKSIASSCPAVCVEGCLRGAPLHFS